MGSRRESSFQKDGNGGVIGVFILTVIPTGCLPDFLNNRKTIDSIE
jgi:hypothetical protein